MRFPTLSPSTAGISSFLSSGTILHVLGVLLVLGTFLSVAPAHAQTIFTVINTHDSGPGSLREAIIDANSTPNGGQPDEIHFNINAANDLGCDSGTGVCTILPETAMPFIDDPVTIDGETQPGAECGSDIPNRVLKIVIDGSSSVEGGYGFALVAGSDGSTIRAVVVNSWTTGITVFNDGNAVECSFLGTDATGTVARLNLAFGMQVSGDNNIVGGITPDAGNLISGNTFAGIHTFGSGSLVVQDNFIGTDVTGTVGLGNGTEGLRANGGDIIGGITAAARNIISGNRGKGVYISSGSGTVVQGNFIGTDVTGTVALGNLGHGVDIKGPGNIVGGTTVAARNVISGNMNGVVIRSVGTTGNLVQGNFIGTDVTGTLGLGNSQNGIRFSAGSFGNSIGGAEAGAANIIAFNTANGVSLFTDAGTGNAILGNSIFANNDLGIDLGGTILDGSDGPTPNDPGDADTGPNKLQNFPDLTDAFINNSGNLLVIYSVDTNPGNASYPMRVEIFAADAEKEEGQTFLDADTYDGADYNGCGAPPCAKTFNLGNAVVFGVVVGDYLVATATDIDGNTSEFSTNQGVSLTRYVATDGSDDGNACTDPLSPCATLARAVNQANDGDIIDLAAGTYSALGVVIGKNLVLQGQGVVVQ